MFQKILIANRGEVALRIQRACHELGIKTVAVYSQADSGLLHVKLADEALCIGPPPAQKSYLNIPSIISAAELMDTSAIHPGYGFLSENADFVEQTVQSGFTFIGPSAETIREMGNKISAKNKMKQLGISTVPGSDCHLGNKSHEWKQLAEEIGYPIILKAVNGGGGRGMRVVESENELEAAVELTRAETMAAFGDSLVYLEKYFDTPRHIEFQVLADNYGNAIHLGERDCSLQRKNQKVVEETPATGISSTEREKLGNIVVQACKDMGYQGAGTFEFLYDEEEFYFIEMNTRLQVEHTVTEMVTGIDIVKQQIAIANGEKLSLKQKDICCTGHAIECRINAENPINFYPSPGVISELHFPGGGFVRVDSHVYQGYEVPRYYDSLIGKLIVWGRNRQETLSRMQNSLQEFHIAGIETNVPLHMEIFKDPAYNRGGLSIKYLESAIPNYHLTS